MRTAWMVALVLACAPAAGQVALSIESPSEPIAPESDGTMTAVLTIECLPLLLSTDPTSAGHPIGIIVATDPLVSVAGPADHVIDDAPCRGGEQEMEERIEYTVRPSLDLPGETPTEVAFQVDFERAAPGSSAPSAQASGTFTSAPFFLLEATIADRLQNVEDNEAVFLVEFTNRGNVAIDIEGSVTTDAAGATVRLPSLSLPIGATESGQITVTFPELRPESLGSQLDLAAAFTPSTASTVGDPVEVSMVVRLQGEPLGESTPAPLGLLGILAVALIARSRSRQP